MSMLEKRCITNLPIPNSNFNIQTGRRRLHRHRTNNTMKFQDNESNVNLKLLYQKDNKMENQGTKTQETYIENISQM